MRSSRLFGGLVVVLSLARLLIPVPASACILQDFEVSTVPALPAANAEFELIINYGRSESGCFLSEDLVVSPDELRFDINCDCIFVTPGPVPHQFRATIPGLPAGRYDFEAIHVDSIPTPRVVANAHVLVGHVPAIPVSPLALTLLTLTLAVAAVWLLRR